jgi:hypothetical protein
MASSGVQEYKRARDCGYSLGCHCARTDCNSFRFGNRLYMDVHVLSFSPPSVCRCGKWMYLLVDVSVLICHLYDIYVSVSCIYIHVIDVSFLEVCIYIDVLDVSCIYIHVPCIICMYVSVEYVCMCQLNMYVCVS